VIAAAILIIAGFAVVYGTYWIGMRRVSAATARISAKCSRS
jgi:hypothetical protein